LNSDDDLVTNL